MIHSCSYYCHKPECIKAQRDELRDKLYKREWVGLTDEEINHLIHSTPYEDDHLLVKKTEALLKEKNA